MEVFELIVDRLTEIWKRDKVTIEAESLEEAVKKALKHDYIAEDSEYIYDTGNTMFPEQVFPYPNATVEVMDEHGNVLKDNYGGGQLQFDT